MVDYLIIREFHFELVIQDHRQKLYVKIVNPAPNNIRAIKERAKTESIVTRIAGIIQTSLFYIDHKGAPTNLKGLGKCSLWG